MSGSCSCLSENCNFLRLVLFWPTMLLCGAMFCDTFWVWWDLWWLFHRKFSRECASEGILKIRWVNWLSYRYALGVPLFWNTVYLCIFAYIFYIVLGCSLSAQFWSIDWIQPIVYAPLTCCQHIALYNTIYIQLYNIYCFIANAKFPESMPVKEFWKSVENWLSYQYALGVPLFWNTVYIYICIATKKIEKLLSQMYKVVLWLW